MAHHVVPGGDAPLAGAADVLAWSARCCLAPVPVERLGVVGAEVESLVVDPAAPEARVPLERVAPLLDPGRALPGGSVLHVEPGGQVEVATVPHPDTGRCVRALEDDLAATRERFVAAGLRLLGAGTDPLRGPGRVVRAVRYDAMEAFFATDHHPEAGPLLMGCSASVQVSVEPGTADEDVRGVRRRWHLAHALGPPLVAAFASSPLLLGRTTGWRCSRQLLWERVDPSRALPAPDDDPVAAWAHALLDARLMFVRDPTGEGEAERVVPVLDGRTFRDWLDGRRDAVVTRAPRVGDLAEHATTLFPPVRPRGPLEVRYLDRPPDPFAAVAVAVVGALLDCPGAAEEAERTVAPHAHRWEDAARLGLADHGMAATARRLLALARDALPDVGAAAAAPALDAYVERFTARSRCPADEVLDALDAGAAPLDVLLDRQRGPGGRAPVRLPTVTCDPEEEQ